MGGLACNGYLNTSTGIKYSGNFRFPASPKWKLLLPLPSESNLTHNTLATRPTDLLYKRNFGICWGSRKLANGTRMLALDERLWFRWVMSDMQEAADEYSRRKYVLLLLQAEDYGRKSD